jgi:hypothetical protein
MATGYPQKSVRTFTKTSRYRDLMRKKSRKLHLEQLEDRRVMAVTGPTLVALATNVGDNLLSDSGVPLANVVLHTNPRELDFRFAQGQKIDPTTLGGIRLVRGGVDGVIGTGDDVSIAPGYVGLLDDPRSVVMRFASALPDDAYLVTVVGSGLSPLKDQAGKPFNGGVNETIAFRLDAGAQVQAVVPQPVSRDPNTLQLSQAADKVTVYFNNDQLSANANLAGNVQNPAFYQLIDTATQNIALPTSVQYSFNATTNTNQAVLTFAAPLAKGTYKLQVGTVVSPSNTLVTAIHEAGPITGTGVVHAYIGDNPTPAAVPVNDVDLYRFDLAVAGNFTATLTAVNTLDGALRIFSSVGTEIGVVTNATAAGGVETRTINPLTIGTYYVGISSAGNVAYNPVTGAGATGGTTRGAYTLSVDFATPAPGLNVQQTSFNDATANANLGILGQAGLNISGSINTLPYTLVFPGATDTPGHRDIPDEAHLGGAATGTTPVAVVQYNFQDVYGFDPQSGQPLHNAITDNQKQRTREILDLYSRYAGIEFIETASSGLIIATGDLRAVAPNIPTGGSVAGIAGGGVAVMNAGINWGNSEYGGSWFQTAMHEIGHLLGQGHTYDLPSITIQGDGVQLGADPGEPVFPGDNDIVHIQTLYRPASRDIDLYKFTLTEAGKWSAETIAERSRATASTNFGGSAVTMQFDSVVYDAAGDGTQVVFTRSDRGAGVDPGISVNLVTRVVSIDLNSNANGTTADRLATLLNTNTAVSQLITAQVVSGPGSTQIAAVAPATYSPLTLRSNTSLLDSVITVYQETQDPNTLEITRTMIARNDNYFGKDSFVDLHLEAGSYYVAVTSKGNTDFDPTVADTGLGGTTQGAFQLKLNFQPDGRFSSVLDVFGTAMDGDADGQPGGTYAFYFQSNPNPFGTLFVDKAYTGAVSDGQLLTPFKTIAAALNAAPARLAAQGTGGVELIRIVGNGGADRDVNTTADNLPYLIGFNYNNSFLADSQGLTVPDQNLIVPKGVTLMVDAGAILKFRKANIEVGTSSQGVDRSHGAIQVLGTPNLPAYFTSFANDLLGGNSNGTPAPIQGEWGGIVMRADSDYDYKANAAYVNYVNHANMTYGGGKVVVNSVESVYNSLHMVSSRPTLTFNTITLSADAAISADPNSFDDSLGRLGPTVHANLFVDPLNPLTPTNSLNGLLVRIRTQFGSPVDVLTVNGRFHNTDIVHIIPEVLYINGVPGGPTVVANGDLIARPSARLLIDPGVVVKLTTSRIEARMGAQLIAEGSDANPVIFTALADNRYGAGGTFSTQKTGNPLPAVLGPLGLWSGLFFGADSMGSLDHVRVFFAGGNSPIEGGFASFSPIEAYQGDVRIANSLFQYNADGQGPGGGRNGRGSNATTGGATIFVRGAQPIVLNNIIRDNAGQVLSINANAMRVDVQLDYGRSTGLLENFPLFGDNAGPLVRLNRLTNNSTNGMEIRGATLTTATVWDDTDIVHVLRGEIIVPDFHSVGGLTLRSGSSESLVVKSFGASAGLTASGTMLDINDRIGGSLYILGQPGHPVVLTSLNDGSVGAGFDPDGLPMNNTNNAGVGVPAPTGNSGAVVVDGGDRDDHGFASDGPDNTPGTADDINNDGWQFIQQMVDFAHSGARNNAPNDILAIGTGSSSQALDAINSAAVVLGFNVTVATGAQISTANFSDYKVIYVPSTENNVSGGITQADLDLLALRKTAIQQFVNSGGSLVALTEAESSTPYSWLELPLPFTITDFTAGGIFFDLRKTQAAIDAGFTITDQELSFGTPYHNDFTGPAGFNGLVPFVLDTGDDNVPGNADDRVITLGLASGSFGIGIQGGTWRGIKLDEKSNDRNVKTVYEVETANAGDTNLHGDPQSAQFIGNLAPDLKSGDDNRKLGFQVHGNISLNNPENVDVYSFTGDSGTEVWIDLDNTSPALQGIVELVDANGNTLARSVVRSPDHNATLVNKLTGLAADMIKDVQDTVIGPQILGAYAGRDYYTQNSVDPGFRVVLPGDNLKGTTYFVRVRSQGAADGSQDNDLTKGLTSGRYQLNIRLRQMDEVPGSQIRYSNINYATIGIDVQGLPLHSYLAGESTAAQSSGNNSFATAQDLGNLLTADRNTISVSGSLAGTTDVQWFKFNLDYDLIQSIGGFSDADKTWATLFDFDYSDGLARPDATISVFDSTGALIFVSRDGQVEADQPQAGQGVDFDDMSRGSAGVLDPYIGTVQLPAGTPGGQIHQYYVAVSSNRGLPAAMDGTFNQGATLPLLRLEPVDSLRRVIEDHVGSQGGSTAAPPDGVAFPGVTTVTGLNQSVAPFNLSDVSLYVHSGSTLNNVDPYAPASPSNPTVTVPSGNLIGDIAFRSDAILYGVQDLPFVQGTSGRLVTINPVTGAITVIGNDNIPDYVPTQNPPNREQDSQDTITAMAMRGSMYDVTVRGVPLSSAIRLYYAIPDQFDPNVSRLYRANPDGGSAAVVIAQPWGRVGQVISDATFSTGTTDFATLGVSTVTFTATNTGPAGAVRIDFVKVNDGNKPAAAVTAVNLLAPRSVTIEINAFTQPARRTTNFNLAGISATFTAVAPGTQGNGIRVLFQQADLGAGAPPLIGVSGSGSNAIITVTLNATGSPTAATGGTTLQDLKTALDADPLAAALISTLIGGAPTTDITQQPTNTYVNPVVLANGRDPATAQDVADAVNNSALAFPLIQNAVAGGTNPNGNVTVADTTVYSPLNLTPGTSGIVRNTTGMAFGNNGNLYGVSDSGAFYQISLSSAAAINAVLIQIPGLPPATFNGLTRGPQNLYNGAYKDLFFASTSNGLVYAINQAGQVQTVFGLVDSLDPVPSRTTVNTGIFSDPPLPLSFNTTDLGGLAFGPIDFNLYHPTRTEHAVAGHGLLAAPDNSRLVNVEGGTSFNYGLEEWNLDPVNAQVYTLPTGGASNAQYGILTDQYHKDLTSNPNIGDNFNVPGDLSGSVITQSFSLQGYAASLKPTIYFNYLNDTFVHARVWASISTDNGASWHTIAGNNEYLKFTTRPDSNNPFVSDPQDPKPAFISASITDAPNNPYQSTQFLWDEQVIWRQARIDLSAYAGLSNLRVQWNVAGTPKVDGHVDHRGFFLDDIIVGFAGRGEMTTGSAPSTGFFTTPAAVRELGRPLPPSQVLNGPYQLEIRRGTEYGATLSGTSRRVTLFETYDPKDNFVPDDRDVISDGFENGNFNALPWVNSSPQQWRITNIANKTGSLSAQAGTATFNPTQSSDLSFTAKTGTGQISFGRKVSSNIGSGTLRFYIDNVLQGQWSGEVPFATVSFPITATVGTATHNFRWSYQKDSADSPTIGILDTAWIDDVRYQAPNVDFEGSDFLPAIFHTSLTPDQIDHSYGTIAAPTTPLNRPDLGERQWLITTADANTGTRSVRSPVLAPNMTSKLSTVKLTGEGTMSFAVRVVGNGTLRFFIDGIQATAITATGWGVLNFVGLTAGYHNFEWIYATAGTVAPTDAAFLDDIVFPTPNIGTGTIGDQNQYREQGSIVIEANKITNSSEIGIAVHPGPRTASGSLPYPSSVINGPTLNNSKLVDGVAIVNNVVANSGQIGILFAGDPNNGLPSAAVPFGRIFNNTVYGGVSPSGTGILVRDNAGPTLLNNIVANTNVGISVDATSSAVVNGAPNTVVGTTVYQRNNTNIVFAGTQTNPIFLTPSDPLFVNAARENFYLASSGNAFASTDFNVKDLNGNSRVTVQFDAVPGGANGNGIQLVFTKLSKTPGAPPVISVNLTTRVISIEMNSVANGGTTAAQLIAMINGNAQASQLVSAKVLSGNPATQIALAATPINYSPLVLQGGGSAKAIDASVDKLDDRFNYVAVKTPLAIDDSPIIAPTTDLFGQLRQDDPANDPTGGGANVFKDVGAIDRVDFDLPTAGLTSPLDNDPPGLDLDPTLDSVLLNNVALSQFEIQLSDVGIGIDDLSVNTRQFVVTEDGVRLVDGVDYLFIYNSNTHTAKFLPSSGTWKFDVQYVITVDNSVATGVKDLAGNTLLPNHTAGPYAGQTVFTILDGILYSFGTAPDPYPTLLADDGARHIIVPGMYLGTGVLPRLDGAPIVPPEVPTGEGDGGIFNFVLTSGLASHFDVTASLPGKLDAWFDLNKNGVWEASEHIVVGQNVAGSNATTTINFVMPTGSTGTTIARFRYSTAGVSLPTGEAPDGEVDDIQVTIGVPPFQNPINSLDVTADGFVSPIDALRIITFLNRFGSQPLPNPNALTAPDYLDTSGDGFVSSVDALLVINYLNAISLPPTGEGEGEGDGIAPASFRSLATGPVSTADAVGSAPEAIPAIIFANSSVVVEVKSPAPSQDLVDDQLFGSSGSLLGDSFQPVIDELHPASRREQKLDARNRTRSEDEQDVWDELLGDLAAEIGLRQES